MLLFQKRVDEGYDLFTDPEYVRWLGIHHPELLPSDRYTLASPSAPKDRGDDQEISLADHFSSIDSGATPILVDQTHDTEQFTSDQMLLFQKRVDEGYNLFTDPEYVRWLDIHHPELLPSDRYTLASPSAPKDRGDDQEISLADHFSSIDSGATPILVDQTHDTEQFTSDQTLLFQKRVDEGYNLFTDPEYVRWLGIHHPELLPSDRYSLASTSDQVTPSNATSRQVVPSTTTSSATTLSSAETSGVSKFLVGPPDTPSTGSKKTSPRARLLTSSSMLEMLLEKEKKKQQELDDKERRKIEREEKRKQKEDLLKQKAEERAKKADEKVKKISRVCYEGTTAW